MAPPKTVKKPPKAMEKPIEKPINKMKKNKRKNYKSFSIYLFKLLRSMSQEQHIGISRHSMLIMDNFVNDMLENIAAEAGRLLAHTKQMTLSSRDIQAAMRLIVPGELAKHANIEGLKAIKLYHNDQTAKM